MSSDQIAFSVPFGPDGRVTSIPFSDPPKDRDVVELARLAVQVAYQLHRGVAGRPEPPPVKWFDYPGPTIGVAPRDRTRGYHVALSTHLRGEELVDTALHEARHVFQHAVPKEFDDHETREADAAGFARKWAPAVMLAWRRSWGEASRISVSRRRPSGWAPSGRLCISASSAKVYQYGRIHGWSKITTG